jgi:hypothetical protein
LIDLSAFSDPANQGMTTVRHEAQHYATSKPIEQLSAEATEESAHHQSMSEGQLKARPIPHAPARENEV